MGILHQIPKLINSPQEDLLWKLICWNAVDLDNMSKSTYLVVCNWIKSGLNTTSPPPPQKKEEKKNYSRNMLNLKAIFWKGWTYQSFDLLTNEYKELLYLTDLQTVDPLVKQRVWPNLSFSLAHGQTASVFHYQCQ